MKIVRLSIFCILMHDAINTTLIMKTIKHVQVLDSTRTIQRGTTNDEIFKDHSNPCVVRELSNYNNINYVFTKRHV